MMQAAFLTLIAVGLVALVSGLLWTRLHWRADVRLYRETAWLEVVLYPERFAEGAALGIVGKVNRAGLLLLLAAVGVVLFKIVQSTSWR
jgi:hypothetical protein